MGKKIAGLLGAMVTLGALNAAEAAPMPSPAPTDVLRANSFADLLEPIPNAVALLQAVDESGPVSSANENIQLAHIITIITTIIITIMHRYGPVVIIIITITSSLHHRHDTIASR